MYLSGHYEPLANQTQNGLTTGPSGARGHGIRLAVRLAQMALSVRCGPSSGETGSIASSSEDSAGRTGVGRLKVLLRFPNLFCMQNGDPISRLMGVKSASEGAGRGAILARPSREIGSAWQRQKKKKEKQKPML